MADITQNEKAEERPVRASDTENLRTYPSGDRKNTTSTLPPAEIARLENLSQPEALLEISMELARLLVLYQNLGGKITGIALPEGKEILAHRHVLVLPAVKTNGGAYALDVPE